MKTTLILFLSILIMYPLSGQDDSLDISRKDALNIFLDCLFCNQSHIKREISFVNYVRDRKEGQVHVLVTSQSTGSGGAGIYVSISGPIGFHGHQ